MKHVLKESRDLLIFITSAVILTFYGSQVCPFLETLKAPTLFFILAIPFLFAWFSRIFIKNRIKKQKRIMEYPRTLLKVDLGLWITVGLIVTAWNFLNYTFPVESGLKVIFGCIALGFFSATYIFLEGEHIVLKTAIDNSECIDILKEKKFFSITSKFLIFFSSTLVIVIGVLLLLVYKDFQYIIETLKAGEPFKFRWVAQEILFVFGLLVVGTFLLTRQYGKILKLIFASELHTLSEIEKGNFKSLIPIITNDEMGVIARHINHMAKELEEKKKIQETFGKYIDKSLADSILQSEAGNELGGRESEICVLFSDIRNFTSISEKLEPEILIKQLNIYFSIIVETVHEHNGMLDKFIGDSAMVVFGLDNNKKMCDSALIASIKIQEKLDKFNQNARETDLPEFITGIGIDSGKVIAGNIGAKERLEYTIIGNTVNTASRVQGQTRDLDIPIIISKNVYQKLNDKTFFKFKELGDFCLKGKSEKVSLFGVKPLIH